MTYWEHNGKHQAIYETLYHHLVPAKGPASTRWGELLRAISKVYNDCYNNGAGNMDVLTSHLETIDEWSTEIMDEDHEAIRALRNLQDHRDQLIDPTWDDYSPVIDFNKHQLAQIEALIDAVIVVVSKHAACAV